MADKISEPKERDNTHTHTDSINVHQRLSAVCRELSGLVWEKTLKNDAFKSIPIDDMRNSVRKACINAGIVKIGPLDIEYDVSDFKGTMRLISGSCKFTYVNIDDPSDTITFESMGEAMDTGDKCVGKFITNLVKNHYKTVFDIGEQGKDDIDSYSNAEMFAEAESIELRKSSKKVEKDPFFGKDKEFESADKIGEEDKKIIAQLNVWGSNPRYKDIVKGAKTKCNVMTVADIDRETRTEIYLLIKDLIESDAGAM